MVPGFAASPDTINDLVRYSELRFNSLLEKELFNNYFFKNEKDYLGLFLALDSNQTRESLEKIKRVYQEHLLHFQTKKFEKKTPGRKVKLLYTYIHENYFDTYEFITYFNEIFSKGSFNCVTASALYAIFMHDLGIPFILRETPEHVYMLAYPDDERIFIETTDPQNRVFQYDFSTKKEYVYHLIDKNVLEEDQVKIQGVDATFSKYFYSNEDIDIDQLIGIHYSNHAAYLLDNKKARESFFQLEKAYMYYPNEKLRFILFTALATAVVNADYRDFDDLVFLSRLPRYTDFDITNSHIIDEFLRLTNNLLVEDENIMLYNKAYDYLINNLSDSSLNKDISFLYNYKTGRYLISVNDIEGGIKKAANAYSLKPDNPDAMSLFIAAITIQVRGLNEHEMTRELEGYLEKFPALVENHVFYSLLLESYLLNISKMVDNNTISSALSLLQKFESGYDTTKKLPVSTSLVVEAYSKLAIYYFKQYKYTESRKYLIRGLKYEPQSSELKYRLNVLDNR